MAAAWEKLAVRLAGAYHGSHLHEGVHYLCDTGGGHAEQEGAQERLCEQAIVQEGVGALRVVQDHVELADLKQDESGEIKRIAGAARMQTAIRRPLKGGVVSSARGRREAFPQKLRPKAVIEQVLSPFRLLALLALIRGRSRVRRRSSETDATMMHVDEPVAPPPAHSGEGDQLPRRGKRVGWRVTSSSRKEASTRLRKRSWLGGGDLDIRALMLRITGALCRTTDKSSTRRRCKFRRPGRWATQRTGEAGWLPAPPLLCHARKFRTLPPGTVNNSSSRQRPCGSWKIQMRIRVRVDRQRGLPSS